MYHLTNYERETIINFNEGEDVASVYTHNKALRRRLEQLAQERPEECKLHKVTHRGECAEFYCPKSWLRINPPRNAAPLTEEQKQQRREQLAELRDSRSKTGRARQDGDLATTGTGKDMERHIPRSEQRCWLRGPEGDDRVVPT